MKKYLDDNGLLYVWGKIKNYVTNAISNKADKGTTLANYGITDANISNGTITLGSNTITPITTETDPTVPSWAKAENKPTYSASEVGAVAANASITGATKTKITYDSKGLVTAGADLAASDIPAITLDKISDVTATAAELNVLDGITATTTELNYVDGVTSAIQTQLNAKAPKASPALTGTPTAPTAAAGTNTTQIATTAFVTSAISTSASAAAVQSVDTTAGTSGINLSLDADGKLDVTISSGSIANGNTNFVTGGTVYSTTNLLAPKASPTFTGTPSAPTAAAGTNTTQIATTAFVTSAVSTAVGDYIPTSAKGAASGVCPLDANTLIDAQYLPSYVDDVIEAYPKTGATELTSGWLASGSVSGTAITPETGKIYVLMSDSTSYAANTQFRWGGSAYVKMADGGVTEITNAEIDTICV